MRFLAGLYIVFTVLSYFAAITHATRPSPAITPAAARNFAAPTTMQPVNSGSIRVQETAAGAAGGGVSLSNSTSQIGGDLSPSHQKVEQEAQAPAGVASPAGAFISHESPPPTDGPTPLTLAEFHDLQQWLRAGKPLAEWLAKHPDPALHPTAVAERPAPVQPVPAPAAVPANYQLPPTSTNFTQFVGRPPTPAVVPPQYQPQRPTFTGYYQGSCGPGGCGPVRGFFGRRR